MYVKRSTAISIRVTSRDFGSRDVTLISNVARKLVIIFELAVVSRGRGKVLELSSGHVLPYRADKICDCTLRYFQVSRLQR